MLKFILGFVIGFIVGTNIVMTLYAIILSNKNDEIIKKITSIKL